MSRLVLTNFLTAVDFYGILFDAITSGKKPANGREGFYFLENGDYVKKQIVETVAKALYKLKKVDTDKPVSLTEAELEAVPSVRLESDYPSDPFTDVHNNRPNTLVQTLAASQNVPDP